MLVVLAGRHQVASGTWKGMDFYLQNAVFEGDDRLETVYRHFERNLSDMLSTAANEDCQVLLSTVAVNLLDCPPFISRDDGDADASYQKGIAQQERADVEGALAAFKEARDLDELRMCADSQLNGIIRRLAGEQSAHVTLVDSEMVFEQSDRGGFNIPGDVDFYDHVHLSFEGNYKVAQPRKPIRESLIRTGLNSGVQARRRKRHHSGAPFNHRRQLFPDLAGSRVEGVETR